MTITFISPTPGTAVGVAGGFSANLSVARETPIIVEITATTRELVKFDTKGDADPSRNVVCRDGVIQGTWAQRTIKTIIGGGYRLSILPPNGWDADELNSLCLSIDTVASGGNISPTANFSSVLNANRTVQFTDSSSDPDGTIVTWAWTFGDAGSSSLQNPSHAYADGGSYSVQLTVTDNLGAATAITKTVNVWTKDATSSLGTPLSAGDWTGALAQAAIVSGGPSSLWRFGVPASGNVADLIGAKTLTFTGSAVTYQAVTAGWTEKSWRTSGGSAAVLLHATGVANINANDSMVIAYIKPSTATVVRTYFRMGTSFDDDATIELQAGVNQLKVGNGDTTRTLGSVNVGGQVRPFVLRNLFTVNTVSALTDQERITAGLVAGAGTELTFGGDNTQTWFPDNCDYMVAALFGGAAARMTEQQLKTLLAAVLGWTIAFVPTQTIAKSGGVSGNYDASSSTGFVLASTVSVQFKVADGGSAYSIGLSADNPDANYTGIDFGLLYDVGTMYRNENGTLVSLGASVKGDVWKITRTIGTGAVTYLKNGGLVSTSPGTSVAALCVDSSIRFASNPIVDVLITDGGGAQLTPTFTNVNTTVI